MIGEIDMIVDKALTYLGTKENISFYRFHAKLFRYFSTDGGL